MGAKPRSMNPSLVSIVVATSDRRPERRVRVWNHCQVRRARPGVEVCQKRVVARQGALASDLAVRVAQVPKHDRIGGACCLAGRQHFTVTYWAIFLLGLFSRLTDALNAVRAFLHYAAAADRDIRVPQEFQ